MSRVLIVGCGDIGLRLTRLCLDAGHEVTVVVRNPERAAALRATGLPVIVGDLDDGSRPLAGLPSAGATIFYFVPPPGGGVIDPRVRVFCGSIEPGEEPAKVIYISTTGVYGDQGGAIVTEETPPSATTPRALRRLDAERLLSAWGEHRGVAIVILRVAGIYGPGRFPLERLQQGSPVLHAEESPYTNRIHADDLAAVCLAAAERAGHGDLFNVCDGETSTMTEYFDAVADAFGLPHPPRVTRNEGRQVMHPLLFSYFSESRRIDPRRMFERLGVVLRYPTLRAGLAAGAAGVEGRP